MNEFDITLLMLVMFTQGIIVGYILWAPETNFKRAFMDGITFKFLWGKR